MRADAQQIAPLQRRRTLNIGAGSQSSGASQNSAPLPKFITTATSVSTNRVIILNQGNQKTLGERFDIIS